MQTILKGDPARQMDKKTRGLLCSMWICRGRRDFVQNCNDRKIVHSRKMLS